MGCQKWLRLCAPIFSLISDGLGGVSWLEDLNLLTQSCSCQEISCQNWGQFDQEMGLSEITKSSKKMEKIKKGSLTHNCTKVSMKSNWNFSLFVCLLTCYCECLYRMINESPCCRLLPFTSLSNIPVAKRSLVLKQLTVANRSHCAKIQKYIRSK